MIVACVYVCVSLLDLGKAGLYKLESCMICVIRQHRNGKVDISLFSLKSLVT